MMSRNINNNNNDLVELMGYTFKRAKFGLDEEQVISFAKEMIEERNKLISNQEHMTSLTKLSERMVTEADRMSKEIIEEAEERAKTEAEAIIARAEEQSRQIAEEKKAEAMAMAEEEVEAIKADTIKQSKILLKDKIESLQSQLRDTAERVYREVMLEAEKLTQEIVVPKDNLDEKPSGVEENTTFTMDAKTAAELSTPAHLEEEPGEGDGEEETISTEINQEANSSQGWAEIEILPPRDKDDIKEIKAQLDSLSEVSKAKLTDYTDKSVIKVTLDKPLNLIETLSGFPEVHQAEELGEGKKKIIQVTLAAKAELERTRNELNSQVNRILSNR